MLETIQIISDIVCDNVELLFDTLEIDYRLKSKMYCGTCPVHGGDNPTAWNFYPEGDDIKGIWRCRTHDCHYQYGQTVVGLVRGVKNLSQRESIKFLCKLYDIDLKKKVGNSDYIDKMRFIKDVRNLTKQRVFPVSDISREKIRNLLEIPAEFYLNRGYSKEILNRYDVGLCRNSKKFFFNRIVVPIYNENDQYIGATGRTISAHCEKCNLWHTGPCPNNDFARMKSCKWINSTDYRAEENLYNINNAKTLIKDTGIAIITEGAGDVWRLEEAGIHNSVAVMGGHFNTSHSSLLNRFGALKLFLLFDNDNAGRQFTKFVEKKFNRLYDIMPIALDYDDVGASPIEYLQDLILPKIEKNKL